MRNNLILTACTTAPVTNHSVQIGSIISGPTLPEAVEVLSVTPYGTSVKFIGRGQRSGQTYDPVLTAAQIAQLTISADAEPFDGEARLYGSIQSLQQALHSVRTSTQLPIALSQITGSTLCSIVPALHNCTPSRTHLDSAGSRLWRWNIIKSAIKRSLGQDND